MNTAEETPQGAPVESKKACDWCRELICIDALKCPHCNKWRKDIEEDINQKYAWLIRAVIFAPAFFLVGAAAEHNGWWNNHWTHDFSLDRFVSSYSGWLVLFCIAGFITSLVKRNHYAKSVKRKTGSGIKT